MVVCGFGEAVVISWFYSSFSIITDLISHQMSAHFLLRTQEPAEKFSWYPNPKAWPGTSWHPLNFCYQLLTAGQICILPGFLANTVAQSRKHSGSQYEVDYLKPVVERLSFELHLWLKVTLKMWSNSSFYFDYFLSLIIHSFIFSLPLLYLKN